MTTDPKAFPGADPHTGSREIDPVSGYHTTGHDWGGIRELNRPFPRIALLALALTFIYSVIAWVLLPAWPLGGDYTRGILGLDQGERALEGAQAMAEIRQDWLGRFEGEPDFAALAADEALIGQVMPAADRLYRDNCAVCHGDEGGGGPMFPVLNDDYWLWGGAPEDIAHTLQVGINVDYPGSRVAVMPAYNWMEPEQLSTLAEHIAAMRTGEADDDSEAAGLVDQYCAACHGAGGAGGLNNGAPSLVDDAVIYGQSVDTVMETLRHGRQGVMPHWSDRMSTAEINLLSLYVARMSNAPPESGS